MIVCEDFEDLEVAADHHRATIAEAVGFVRAGLIVCECAVEEFRRNVHNPNLLAVASSSNEIGGSAAVSHPEPREVSQNLGQHIVTRNELDTTRRV